MSLPVIGAAALAGTNPIIMIVSAGAAAHSIARMVPSIKRQRLAP
jgi:hypothetical protein